MKEIGIVAVLLAVLAAGVWIRSETPSAHVSEQQPGTYVTPDAPTSDSTTADGARNSSFGHPGAASLSERSQLKQKLAHNDQELSTAQDQLFRIQDKIQTSDIDRQIQQQQQTVMDLQAQARNMGGQSTSQLQNQAILADQDNQLLQQKITGLQQQIQNQQEVSNSIELQLRHTIAPDDSDIMISLNNQLQTSEQQKQRLRSEFNSVLQQQQQLAMNRYAGQAQAQQQQQAGAVSTDVALEQAKNRLDELGRQKQALFNEAEQTQRRVDQLQSERSELLNQPQ